MNSYFRHLGSADEEFPDFDSAQIDGWDEMSSQEQKEIKEFYEALKELYEAFAELERELEKEGMDLDDLDDDDIEDFIESLDASERRSLSDESISVKMEMNGAEDLSEKDIERAWELGYDKAQKMSELDVLEAEFEKLNVQAIVTFAKESEDRRNLDDGIIVNIDLIGKEGLTEEDEEYAWQLAHAKAQIIGEISVIEQELHDLGVEIVFKYDEERRNL